MDTNEIIQQLRERNAAQSAEIAALRAQIDGNREWWQSAMQMRCDRQRKALDRLNRKVLTQRFRLNLLKSLGRDVTYDEYMSARGENDRIGEYVVV